MNVLMFVRAAITFEVRFRSKQTKKEIIKKNK